MDGLTEGRIVHFVMPDGKEHRPAIIVKVWDNERGTSNLQVFTDGSNDLHHISYPHDDDSLVYREMSQTEVVAGISWQTSIEYSEEKFPFTWHWIEKA